MFQFRSGVLDKTNIVSNILMLVLLAGNIYLSIQYITNMQIEQNAKVDNTSTRIQTSRVLKEYIDIVLNTQGSISYDDRVKLESDVRQLQNPLITKQWDAFVGSKDAKTAQGNAVKLMSMLANKMIE